MTYYPQAAATEEDGPNCDPILSNHIFPAQLTRLRESRRRMSVLQKLTRETAGFHEEAARRHGVNTTRGLAHFRAARAYREGDSKLMEYFENGGQSPSGHMGLDPKAECTAHQEAVKFHKKMAEKHGLDTDEGHAHVALMEHHMDLARHLKQKKQQAKASQAGAQGRQSPMPGIPKKSEQRNPDIRQNWKPVVKLQQRKTQAAGKGLGPYTDQKYDKSHPEGFKKSYDFGGQ